MPAMLRRKETSSAKNIASAPTSIAVRARRSNRPMYGTIRCVVLVASPMASLGLYAVPFPAGAPVFPLGRRNAFGGEGGDRKAERESGADLRVPLRGPGSAA